MTPAELPSHWIQSTSPTSYPPLTTDETCDVVVVGAGIAGLCTAWELVQQGRTVVVLEAARVAEGVTGHTTAKVTALHTTAYRRMAGRHGPEVAALYAQSQQDAVEHVASIATRLGIDCELESRPAFTYVESADGVDEIRQEAEAALAAGLPASFTTETGLPFEVAGAVRVEDQAQFHPRKFLLAVADAITRAGGVVHEQARVVALEEGDRPRVRTGAGHTVTAQHVVVATHFPIFDRGLLFARMTPRRDLVVATPIPAEADPGGMYITREDNVRSVRTAPHPDGRLLIVTGEPFEPGSGGVAERYDRLEGWTRDRFGVTGFSHRWAAQDNDTTDGLPFVGPLHALTEHVWVATGFGGWGMTNGVVAARVLAAAITGNPLPWGRIYSPARLDLLAETGPLLKAQGRVGRHVMAGRLRKGSVDSVEELAPGQGAVVRVGAHQCAAFRDADGGLHTVSARCTHLGCIVGFNDAELVWECPCHGSRFDVDGRVIQGPATAPLPPEDL